MQRRAVLLGLAASGMGGFAEAKNASLPLPGGGRISVPSPYKHMPPTDSAFEPGVKALIAFKNWRRTMSGYPECDGMIAAAPASGFASLDAFMSNAQNALTINWNAARTQPGPWGGEEKLFPLQRSTGPIGEEAWRALSVQIVGFFQEYRKTGMQYARLDRKGLMTGVWIFDADGGIKRAHKLADTLSASFGR